MPWITYEAIDVVGWGWVAACLLCTAVVITNIYRAPLEPEADIEPHGWDVDDFKGRIAWHNEQAEAAIASACELYGVDYRSQNDEVVDLVEEYVTNSAMRRIEFENEMDDLMEWNNA